MTLSFRPTDVHTWGTQYPIKRAADARLSTLGSRLSAFFTAHARLRPRLFIIAYVALALCALVFVLSIGVRSITTRQSLPTWATTAHSPDRGVADWTVLVYMASDNDLESSALADLREIAQVGSSARVTVVAQVDRMTSSQGWDSPTAGNWSGTKRFLIEPGMEPDAAMAIACLDELNTGDPDTLSDFIAWGMDTYPATHYALILWSHGGSWMGLASDETSGGDSLSLPELGAALASAHIRSGGVTLDLIGFDACLMGQLDVFQTIAPYARVAVASAEIEPTQGWAWDVWLRALTANPDQDAASIAGIIVDSYVHSYQGSDDVTLAAFDLAQVGQISADLDRLTSALLAGTSADGSRISLARTAAATYAPSTPDAYNAVDLGDLIQLLGSNGASHEVVVAAEETGRAIQHARLAYGAGQSHNNGSGISIYFPPTAAQYLHSYEHESPLTHWADFLKAYHTSNDRLA